MTKKLVQSTSCSDVLSCSGEQLQYYVPPQVVDTLATVPAQIALFDADGTLWEGDVAESFVEWLFFNEHINNSQWAHWQLYKQLDTVSAASACFFMLHFFTGFHRQKLDVLICEFWQNHWLKGGLALNQEPMETRWLSETVATLRWLAVKGWEIIVVSASPQCMLVPLEKVLPVNKILALQMAVDERDYYVYGVLGIPTVGAGKAAAVDAYQKMKGVGQQKIALAAGNSLLDLQMLQMSETVAWAVNADDDLSAIANKRGWFSTCGRKT